MEATAPACPPSRCSLLLLSTCSFLLLPQHSEGFAPPLKPPSLDSLLPPAAASAAAVKRRPGALGSTVCKGGCFPAGKDVEHSGAVASRTGGSAAGFFPRLYAAAGDGGGWSVATATAPAAVDFEDPLTAAPDGGGGGEAGAVAAAAPKKKKAAPRKKVRQVSSCWVCSVSCTAVCRCCFCRNLFMIHHELGHNHSFHPFLGLEVSATLAATAGPLGDHRGT